MILVLNRLKLRKAAEVLQCGEFGRVELVYEILREIKCGWYTYKAPAKKKGWKRVRKPYAPGKGRTFCPLWAIEALELEENYNAEAARLFVFLLLIHKNTDKGLCSWEYADYCKWADLNPANNQVGRAVTFLKNLGIITKYGYFTYLEYLSPYERIEAIKRKQILLGPTSLPVPPNELPFKLD